MTTVLGMADRTQFGYEDIGLMRSIRQRAPRSVVAQMKTQAEAAAYLGLCPNTLSGYRRRGIGPKGHPYKGHVLYPVAELDKWKAGMA